METLTVTTLTDTELDILVKELFPNCGFEFVADYEANNDSDYLFSNVKKGDFLKDVFPPDDPDYKYKSVKLNNLNEFMDMIVGNRNCMYRVNFMINFLVHVGKLPEGNILVKVS